MGSKQGRHNDELEYRPCRRARGCYSRSVVSGVTGGSYRIRLLTAGLLCAAACSGGHSTDPDASRDASTGQPCVPGGDACPEGQACDIVELVCLPSGEACTERPCEETVLDIPAILNRDLDVLFVVDNSGGMWEQQLSMAANFPRFIDVLETLPGGLPNLNIGVVSTDVGAGPYGIAGCSVLGDNGVLQATRGEGAPAGCTGPSDPFIKDWDDGSGGRLRKTPGWPSTSSCSAASSRSKSTSASVR